MDDDFFALNGTGRCKQYGSRTKRMFLSPCLRQSGVPLPHRDVWRVGEQCAPHLCGRYSVVCSSCERFVNVGSPCDAGLCIDGKRGESPLCLEAFGFLRAFVFNNKDNQAALCKWYTLFMKLMVSFKDDTAPVETLTAIYQHNMDLSRSVPKNVVEAFVSLPSHAFQIRSLIVRIILILD